MAYRKIKSSEESLRLIQASASIEVNHLLPNLMRLIGYRQRVAQELLSRPESNKDELSELYDHINDQIKILLAIS